MIYTVTFNPSLDYNMYLSNFKYGDINRAVGENISVGGKGINSSKIFSVLGHESIALGFVAGFVGTEIIKQVGNLDFGCDFIILSDGISRININIMTEIETKINGRGPIIEDKHIIALLTKLKKLKEGDVLVLAGSVPPCVNSGVYARILADIDSKGVITVVDAEGELLTKSLKYKPFLIKPNLNELRGLFDNAIIKDKDSVLAYAKLLRELGARNVLVSMGGDGAVLLTENGLAIKSTAPSGNVINTVGAGDAMAAGFIAGFIQTGDYEYALRLGTACGSASAFAKKKLTLTDIEKIMFNVIIESS